MDRYQDFKKCDFAGLDQLPSHWKVKPLWSVSNQKSIIENEGLELLSVYLDKGVIRFSDVDQKRTNVTSEDTSKYQRVDFGDFVLNNQQAWRGSVGVSKHTGIVSPAYIVLEMSSELDPNFSSYLLRDQIMVGQYLTSSKGVGSIQRNLFFPYLRLNQIIIPPLNEQKLIARYLDKKTEQIDRLVEKIQKKIGLLKEQRTSLINHYVTKGLNPDVEMKDSGIDWVGDIPKHWEVKKLKHTADVTLGKMLTPENKGGMYKKKYLRSVNVQEDYLDLDDINEMWFSENEIQKLSILHGDILVNEGGQVGRPCFIYENLIDTGFQNSINRIRTNKSDSYYLYLVILSGFKLGYYDSIVDRVSIPHLTKEKLENSSIIHPPKTEQQAISKKIEAKISFFSTRLNKQEERLALIREYRQSLISSAVTGKIRIKEDMI